jgi:polar amino acid transport system substrate-binding protein
MAPVLIKTIIGTVLSGLLLVTAQSQAEPLTLVTLEQPPIQLRVGDQVKGIAIDLVQEVFARMDQPFDIHLLPFPRALNMVQKGQADGILTIVKNQEREAYLTFTSEALLDQEAVLIVRKNDPVEYQGDFNVLNDYTFGVISQATYGKKYEEAVTNGVITNFEYVHEYQQSIKMLISGRIDVMIGPRLTLLYGLQQLGYRDKVRILYPPIEIVPTYIAFTGTNYSPEFLQRFDETLAEMKRDGTYRRIIERYVK